MREYTGTVLILDEKPDLNGDSFSKDSIINIADRIPVTLQFENTPEGYLGEVILIKNDDKIDYKIQLIDEKISDQMAKTLTPCIGGSIKSFIKTKKGRAINKFTIKSIGLSVGNADTRIKKLGEE